MQLTATPLNPVPDGAELFTVETRDGVPLRAAAWPASGLERGTVLILQGRAEFIEKYFEVVEELRGRGLSVVTFDWRGQGQSGRRHADPYRGHVRHFSEFRNDLDAVGEALAARRDRAGTPPGPIHVLAHSMGGCIALTAAAEGWLQADSLVALTPMVGLSLVKHPALARSLARMLNRLGLGERYVPGGRAVSISLLPFPANRLCADQQRYDRNAAVAEALGAGAIGSPTIGWVDAAYEAMRRLGAPGVAERITLPVLAVAAGNDPICSTEAIAALAARLPSGRLLVVPEARHEILHESDSLRSLFWDAFDGFVSDVTRPEAGLPERALAVSR